MSEPFDADQLHGDKQQAAGNGSGDQPLQGGMMPKDGSFWAGPDAVATSTAHYVKTETSAKEPNPAAVPEQGEFERAALRETWDAFGRAVQHQDRVVGVAKSCLDAEGIADAHSWTIGELAAAHNADMRALKQRIAELEEKLDRFLKGDFKQFCAYCGWESEEGTWEELQSHVALCPEHWNFGHLLT